MAPQNDCRRVGADEIVVGKVKKKKYSVEIKIYTKKRRGSTTAATKTTHTAPFSTGPPRIKLPRAARRRSTNAKYMAA